MTSTVLDPIAEALKNVAGSVSGVTSSHKWILRDTDTRPAAVVELPIVRRTPIDAPEDHLGSNDWRTEWTVVFYFDFTDTDKGQEQAAEAVESWIKAVDANPTLTLSPGNAAAGVVQETKVIEVGPVTLDERKARPLIVYPTRVEILSFI